MGSYSRDVRCSNASKMDTANLKRSVFQLSFYHVQEYPKFTHF